VPHCATLDKGAVNGAGAVMAAFLCRVPSRPLGKEVFADENATDGSLPSVALSKDFAKGKYALALGKACVSSHVPNA
jgi:hypothetical protein